MYVCMYAGIISVTSATGLTLSVVMLFLSAAFLLAWLWSMLRSVVIGYLAAKRIARMAGVCMCVCVCVYACVCGWVRMHFVYGMHLFCPYRYFTTCPSLSINSSC